MLKSLDAIQRQLGAASKDICAEKWYDLRCNAGRLPKTSASCSLIPRLGIIPLLGPYPISFATLLRDKYTAGLSSFHA